MASFTPLGASGERRIRSRDSPRVPHGTKDCRATICPEASRTSTATLRPSVRSASRFRAMEKPRSASSPRHCSESSTICCMVVASSWLWRCTVMVQPASRTRATARLTGRIARPSSVNVSVSRTASSPSGRARRPAFTYASAPVSEADSTPIRQACSRPSRSHAAIASCHASGWPSGSPDARQTVPITR